MTGHDVNPEASVTTDSPTTRTVTPDVPRLRKTLHHIEDIADTGQWYQGGWRVTLDQVLDDLRVRNDVWFPFPARAAVDTDACGTAMCFAGWTCHLAGGQWQHPADHPLSDLVEIDGVVLPAAMHAQRLLGLSGEQAAALFDAGNDLSALNRIVDQVETEAGVTP